MQHFIFRLHLNLTAAWLFLMQLQQLKKKTVKFQTIFVILAAMQKVLDMEQDIFIRMHIKTTGLHSNIYQMNCLAGFSTIQVHRDMKTQYVKKCFPVVNFKLPQYLRKIKVKNFIQARNLPLLQKLQVQ